MTNNRPKVNNRKGFCNDKKIRVQVEERRHEPVNEQVGCGPDHATGSSVTMSIVSKNEAGSRSTNPLRPLILESPVDNGGI